MWPISDRRCQSALTAQSDTDEERRGPVFIPYRRTIEEPCRRLGEAVGQCVHDHGRVVRRK